MFVMKETLVEPLLYTFTNKCLLAHLAEGHESLCHGAATIVRRQLFPLNDFSRTTRPISTKLGRKHAWGDGDSDLFK